MKSLALAPFGLIALALPLGTAADLAFTIADTELQKTLTEKSSWQLDSMLQSFGGTVVADEAPPMTTTLDRRFALLDGYGGLHEDGAPRTFTRTFEELSVLSQTEAEIDDADFRYLAELGSDLVDVPVRFTRNGDGTYRAELEDDAAADATLLEGLLADMDLIGVLPGEEVEEGDEWTLEEEGLRSLLALGGAPTLRLDNLEGDWIYIMPSDIAALTIAHLGETAQEIDGEARVVWTSTSEVDGQRLALLTIEFEASADADLGERLVALLETGDAEDPREELTLETGLTLEGTAQVTWNLTAGRAQSVELSSEAELTVEMTWLQEMQGQELEFEGEYGLIGQVALSFAVEER